MKSNLRNNLNRIRIKNSDREALDISSLIDVSFLLLIYFLVTSTLEPREGDLGLTMIPEGGKTMNVDDLLIRPVIEVNDAGIVFFQEEMLDSNIDRRELVLLHDRLRTFQQASHLINPQNKVGVDVDVADSVPGQRFIDVLNCLAELGISDVRFLK